MAYDTNSEIIDCNEVISNALNNRIVSFDDLIDSIYVIKLETIPESLFGMIENAIITDNNIYIKDYDGNVIIFDNVGNFKKRLARGEGPEELRHALSLSYNQMLNQLNVFQISFVNKYTSEGDFVTKSNVHFTTREAISYGNGFNLMLQYPHENLLDKYLLVTIDSIFNPLDAYEFSGNYPLFKSFKTMTYSSDGGEYIVRFFDNNIYLFRNDSLMIKYKLEYSDYEMNIEETNGNFNLKKYSSQDNKFYFGGTFAENSGYQIFSLCNPNNRCVCVRNNRTKVMRAGFDTETTINGLGVLLFYGIFDIYRDSFVCCFDYNEKMKQHFESLTAGKQISQEDVVKIKGLKEEDNPLLILYKLKGLD